MSERLEELKAALSGKYEIEKELGHGGMATVYLARDLRHDRDVAVKVLRADLAEALGPDRFLREIKIAANLNHPHILPLHDSGEAGGFLYYVMPVVEGETLSERLEQSGELPISEAVRIVHEVVDALAYAHAHGVIHRDIKPSNVMLSGRHAVVTDFGVAKAVSAATDAQTLTDVGVAIGTPAYMSPEQATADPHVDHRADIYSVGAMMYELLAGRTPFLGPTHQAILAAHVADDVEPVSKYRDHVSPALEALVMKCLEKKPSDRWQSAEEMLPHLESLATSSGGLTPADTMPVSVFSGPGKFLNPMVIGVVAAVAVIGVFGSKLLKTEPFNITTSNIRQVTYAPGLEFDPTISPDGNDIVYSQGALQKTHLYMRNLDDLVSGGTLRLGEELRGWERHPQWHPDGQSVIFHSSEQGTSSIGRLGGLVRSINTGGARYVALSAHSNKIAFTVRDSIFVGEVDGDATLLGKFGVAGGLHSPTWSPDGRWIAFVDGNFLWVEGRSLGNVLSSRIWIVDAESGEAVAVTESEHMDMSPQWLPDSRHLLFMSDMDGPRDIYVVEVGVDGARGSLARVTSGGADPHSISVSADGSRLAYSKFTFRRNIRSIPIPDGGSVSISESRAITSGNQVIEQHDVSPDGAWIAYDGNVRGNADIFKLRIDGGDPIPLTSGTGDEFNPKWSPDGTEILFTAFTADGSFTSLVDSDGTGGEQLGRGLFPVWSPDGSTLAGMLPNTEHPLNIMARNGVGGDWSSWEVLGDGLGFSDCFFGPAWSPGQNLVCVHRSGIDVVSRDGETRSILLFDNGNGSPSPISGIGPRYSRDGSTIYFIGSFLEPNGEQSHGVWSIPTTGGDAKLVVEIDDPSLYLFFRGLSVGPEHLYLSIAEYESDIWVMDLEWED